MGQKIPYRKKGRFWPMSEADLLHRAAARAAAAAQLAALLAGVDAVELDTEVAAMGDACEAAMRDWNPGSGWWW